jgi:hypothetical protein
VDHLELRELSGDSHDSHRGTQGGEQRRPWRSSRRRGRGHSSEKDDEELEEAGHDLGNPCGRWLEYDSYPLTLPHLWQTLPSIILPFILE